MGKKEIFICVAAGIAGVAGGILATKKGWTDKAAKSLGLGKKEEETIPVAQAQVQNQEPVAKPMQQSQQKA